MRESHDEVNGQAEIVEKFEVGDVAEQRCFNNVIRGANVLHDNYIEALFEFGNPLNQDINQAHQDYQSSEGLKCKKARDGNALSKSSSEEHPVLMR